MYLEESKLIFQGIHYSTGIKRKENNLTGYIHR